MTNIVRCCDAGELRGVLFTRVVCNSLVQQTQRNDNHNNYINQSDPVSISDTSNAYAVSTRVNGHHKSICNNGPPQTLVLPRLLMCEYSTNLKVFSRYPTTPAAGNLHVPIFIASFQRGHHSKYIWSWGSCAMTRLRCVGYELRLGP
jgi:hypothetical protein